MRDIPWIPLTKENYNDIRKTEPYDTVYSCFDTKTGRTYTEYGYFFSGVKGDDLYNGGYMSSDYYRYNPETGWWTNSNNGAIITAYCELTPFKFELEG
jgi:hypothetical protein